MKKIEIKKFKTAPDLAKMIEEGHKVHAMANGKIQSYERHTPQPEDYSNLDDFMEVAENHINELYNTRQEVDEMLSLYSFCQTSRAFRYALYYCLGTDGVSRRGFPPVN